MRIAITLLILLGTIRLIAMDQNSSSRITSKKLAPAQEHYANTLSHAFGQSDIKIKSYFDYAHNHALKDALVPYAKGQYDLRGYELQVHRLFRMQQPLILRHRGKVGFGVGMVAGVGLVVCGFAVAVGAGISTLEKTKK